MRRKSIAWTEAAVLRFSAAKKSRPVTPNILDVRIVRQEATADFPSTALFYIPASICVNLRLPAIVPRLLDDGWSICG